MMTYMGCRSGTFTANNKFMTRLLLKHGSSVPLMVLVGHECFMGGSFRLALGEYLMAYSLMPDEPILSLCIGWFVLLNFCISFTHA